MAGALNSLADNGGYSMQPAVDYGDSSPLASPAPSYMPGVSPGMLSVMNSPPPGPASPYARRLDDASQAIIGDPDKISGALESAQGKRSAAVQAKKAAIARAMQMLSALNSGQSNLPLMAGAVGALQPTRTGSIGETIGNAFGAALPQIEKQRAIERALAASLGQGGIDEADVDMEGAKGDEAALEKRFSIASQMGNEAGRIQNAADLNTYRTRQGMMQYAGKIGAAEISANKNRWQFIGNDPNDPTVGRYLDKNSPTQSVVAGPAAGARPSATGASAGGVAKWRYDMWLANHPGDTAGAEDASLGRRKIPDAQLHMSARTEAARELGVGADPADIAKLADQIYSGAKDVEAQGGASPPPAGNQPPPHQATPPPNFKKAPDGFFYAPDPARPGKYLKWTG